MDARLVFMSIVFLAVLPAFPANAANCKETTFGKCFNVRGRYAIYADGDYLWIVGTKRILGTTNDDLDKILEKAGWEDYAAYGDFNVCPTSKYRPGHMQGVCIESYANTKVRKWVGGRK
jgi:hypothetical protein